jgi:hypothetical protein
MNNTIRYEPTFVVSKKLENLKKIRDQQKDNHDLLSAIWKENFIKDSDKIKHIFM